MEMALIARQGLLWVSISKRVYSINPIALKRAKIVHNFGLSECNRLNYIIKQGFLFSRMTPNIYISL